MAAAVPLLKVAVKVAVNEPGFAVHLITFVDAPSGAQLISYGVPLGAAGKGGKRLSVSSKVRIEGEGMAVIGLLKIGAARFTDTLRLSVKVLV